MNGFGVLPPTTLEYFFNKETPDSNEDPEIGFVVEGPGGLRDSSSQIMTRRARKQVMEKKAKGKNKGIDFLPGELDNLVLFFPVHLPSHWALGVVAGGVIFYFDSMSSAFKQKAVVSRLTKAVPKLVNFPTKRVKTQQQVCSFLVLFWFCFFFVFVFFVFFLFFFSPTQFFPGRGIVFLVGFLCWVTSTNCSHRAINWWETI